jgi:hypothetical protein
MTKAELVSAMADGAGISKAAAASALESYIGTVAKEAGACWLWDIFRNQEESKRRQESPDWKNNQDTGEKSCKVQSW